MVRVVVFNVVRNGKYPISINECADRQNVIDRML